MTKAMPSRKEQKNDDVRLLGVYLNVDVSICVVEDLERRFFLEYAHKIIMEIVSVSQKE